jgi:ubiquinone/menaquinone biosynthesis C-methylase UbiE
MPQTCKDSTSQNLTEVFMSPPNKPLPLPQNPSGFVGQLFGKLMEWTNGNAYKKAIEALDPAPNERFLELGFGTGRFAEMLLMTRQETFMAGVDPTSTMVKIAIDRLISRGFSDRIDLREGTDESLPWVENQFDAVIAIHCFQFWKDPDLSLIEIGRVLSSRGRIVIVFRDHSSKAPAWLPNPMSRSGQEIELATSLLKKYGYTPVEHSAAGSSRIIRAHRNAA